jgi:hypothetical protein
VLLLGLGHHPLFSIVPPLRPSVDKPHFDLMVIRNERAREEEEGRYIIRHVCWSHKTFFLLLVNCTLKSKEK